MAGPVQPSARTARPFTDRVTADGRDGWPVEAGRYRLVISRACPWASRTAISQRDIAGVFRRLDALSEGLAGRRYLLGDTVTEADIRLFTTLVRFDAVHHGHFKRNVR